MLSTWCWPSRSHGTRTAWLLIVMPRSRSMSIRSRYCARAARSSTTPVSCSIRSARVDLPWSMWAMMQKFRMTEGSVRPGAGTLAGGVTDEVPRGTFQAGTGERSSSHAGRCEPESAGRAGEEVGERGRVDRGRVAQHLPVVRREGGRGEHPQLHRLLGQDHREPVLVP